VQVVGYLVGKPHANSGESVNCKLTGATNNDFHLTLADDPASEEFSGIVVDKGTTTERLTLAELARVAYFRPDTLPPGFQAELMATRHYVPRAWPFAFTNGIQASYLEVDTDSSSGY